MNASRICDIVVLEKSKQKSRKERYAMNTARNVNSYLKSEHYDKALDCKQGLYFICTYKVRRRELYVGSMNV